MGSLTAFLSRSIHFLLLYNKLPHTWWFKTTHIYHFTVLVCLQSRHSVAGSSAWDLISLSQGIGGATFLSGGLNGGGSAFKLSKVDDGVHFLLALDLRPQLLAGYMLETCLCSWRMPVVHCHAGFPSIASCFSQPARRVFRASLIEDEILGNVI